MTDKVTDRQKDRRTCQIYQDIVKASLNEEMCKEQ